MKLKPDANIVEFIRTVQHCSCEVYFCTTEGDRLNLCSRLTQCLFSVIAANREILDAGTIELSDVQRLEVLKDYLIQE